MVLDEITPEQIEELGWFHCTDVGMIEKDDDEFCGIRAHHFVVEIGFSEMRQGVMYLISANHKGIRAMTLIEMKI